LPIVALDSSGPANHHMIGASDAGCWNEIAGKRPEAALHTVADDCAADLLGNGKADAHRWVLVGAIADQQDEAGGRGSLAFIGGKEIRALADRD